MSSNDGKKPQRTYNKDRIQRIKEAAEQSKQNDPNWYNNAPESYKLEEDDELPITRARTPPFLKEPKPDSLNTEFLPKKLTLNELTKCTKDSSQLATIMDSDSGRPSVNHLEQSRRNKIKEREEQNRKVAENLDKASEKWHTHMKVTDQKISTLDSRGVKMTLFNDDPQFLEKFEKEKTEKIETGRKLSTDFGGRLDMLLQRGLRGSKLSKSMLNIRSLNERSHSRWTRKLDRFSSVWDLKYSLLNNKMNPSVYRNHYTPPMTSEQSVKPDCFVNKLQSYRNYSQNHLQTNFNSTTNPLYSTHLQTSHCPLNSVINRNEFTQEQGQINSNSQNLFNQLLLNNSLNSPYQTNITSQYPFNNIINQPQCTQTQGQIYPTSQLLLNNTIQPPYPSNLIAQHPLHCCNNQNQLTQIPGSSEFPPHYISDQNKAYPLQYQNPFHHFQSSWSNINQQPNLLNPNQILNSQQFYYNDLQIPFRNHPQYENPAVSQYSQGPLYTSDPLYDNGDSQNINKSNSFDSFSLKITDLTEKLDNLNSVVTQLSLNQKRGKVKSIMKTYSCSDRLPKTESLLLESIKNKEVFDENSSISKNCNFEEENIINNSPENFPLGNRRVRFVSPNHFLVVDSNFQKSEEMKNEEEKMITKDNTIHKSESEVRNTMTNSRHPHSVSKKYNENYQKSKDFKTFTLPLEVSSVLMSSAKRNSRNHFRDGR